VDFAGETVPIVDPASGEIEHAYVYVAVLGASNYTYAEATMAQDLESWVALTRNALEFFEGSAEIWVPDNLKAGVSRTCRYEPDINPHVQRNGRILRSGGHPCAATQAER